MLGRGTVLNLLVYTVTINDVYCKQYINTRTHVHIPTFSYTYSHTYIHTYIHTYVYIRRAKDFKNRELFEKMFPELKARREQQERFTRYHS